MDVHFDLKPSLPHQFHFSFQVEGLESFDETTSPLSLGVLLKWKFDRLELSDDCLLSLW